VIIFVPATLLLACAIFFWIKDVYSHTLKDPEDRIFFFEFIKWVSLYLPIALQAIFLFCYAMGQAILISSALSNFIAFNIYSDLNEVQINLESIKIIFIGSLLISAQYLLLRTNLFDSKGLSIVAKCIAWLISIFFLKLLIENILYSLAIQTSTGLTFSYNNDYMWVICLLLTLSLTFVRGDWIYVKELNSLKSLSLTARILSVYSLFIILITLPRIIYALVEYMK